MKIRRLNGFTLIELYIVIAIIAIIAAIAIPNLLRARLAGNEASAISSLRTVVSSQAMFYQSDLENAPEYADTLGCLWTHDLIDSVLGQGTESGYIWAIVAPDSAQPYVTAVPATPISGKRSLRARLTDPEGGVDPTSEVEASECGNTILEGEEECEFEGRYVSVVCPEDHYCDGCCRCLPGEETNLRNQAPLVKTTIMANRAASLAELEQGGFNLIANMLAMVPGTNPGQAVRYTQKNKFRKRILRLLDTQGDGALSLEELTSADILGIAKQVAADLGLQGVQLNIDESLIKQLLSSYQLALKTAIEPGMTPDEVLPTVPLKEFKRDPRAKALLHRVPAYTPNDLQ